MKTLLLILTFSFNAFGHGIDEGPSSLEDEFSRSAHFHLPLNYSTTEGLSFNYHFGGHRHEHEQPREEHSEDRHGEHTGLEIDLHPSLFVGHDRLRKLISLEEARNDSEEIEASSEQGEFLLLENRKWDLGLGLSADAHLPLPTFSAGLGISFLKGKNYYTIRRLSHRYEERGPLLLPLSDEALKGWRVGDQLSWGTRGSIIFNASVGIDPLVHFGPVYALTGSYRVKLHLLKERLLEVQLITLRATSLSVEASVFPVTLEAGRTKGHLTTMLYRFDLNYPGSLRALGSLLQGRVDLTNQELIASGGKIHFSSDLLNRSSSRNWTLNLPALYARGGSSGDFSTQGSFDEDGDIHEIHSSSQIRESFSRGILSRHKWETRSVIATLILGEEPVLSGLFSWSLSSDRVRASKLKERLALLAQTFGRNRLARLKWPTERLNYLRAELSANFSAADVLFLLDGDRLKGLKVKALQKLEEDFEQKGHRSFCRVRGFTSCLSRYRSLVESRHLALVLIRRRIEKSYKDLNMREVTLALRDFIAELLSSKYLTYSFLSERPDFSLKLRLEGEGVKQHVLSL